MDMFFYATLIVILPLYILGLVSYIRDKQFEKEAQEAQEASFKNKELSYG